MTEDIIRRIAANLDEAQLTLKYMATVVTADTLMSDERAIIAGDRAMALGECMRLQNNLTMALNAYAERKEPQP